MLVFADCTGEDGSWLAGRQEKMKGRLSGHKHNTAYCFCGLSESVQVCGNEHVCVYDISGPGGLAHQKGE